jgi:hypothetical protein
MRVISRISAGLEKTGIGSKPLGHINAPKKFLIAVAVLASILWIVAAGGSPFGSRPFTWRVRKEKASAIYEKSLKIIAKKGFKRSKSQTPRELASEVLRRGGGGYMLFSDLTEKYLSLRFGRDVSDEGYGELEQMVEELKKYVRKTN